MTLEIHQGEVGTVALSGDNGSIQMVWNNIIGKNFNDGKDFTDWMNYLNTVIIENFGSTKKVMLVKDGKVVDEDDRLSMYRRPLIGGVKKLEDIAILEGTKVVGLKPEANELLRNRLITGRSYYFNFAGGDEKATRLFASYDHIIGSILIAYVYCDSLPKEQPEVVLDKTNPVEDAIKSCTVDGNIIKLPVGQLDPKTFKDVKKQLENIGGKWNTSAQGFKYDNDPAELLAGLVKGDKTNLKQDFQFFETPSELIDEMIERADIQPTDVVLEPSAGKGAIVEKLLPLAKKVDMCEFMDRNKIFLEELGYKIIGSDFLLLDETLKYDKIVANPPFSKNQDITHVMKMYDHLKTGGKLVVITSTAWITGSQKKQIAFREFLDSVGAVQEEVAEGTFKKTGTNVKTMLLEITKKD